MASSTFLFVAAIRRTFDGHLVGAAEPLELALLQHAQQLHLDARIHVGDLVEEQRAAVGQLEPPLLARHGAGERALLVAEELRLDQRVGQRRAAHLHERLRRAQRVVVDGVRNQFLAGARLAANHDRRVRARDLGDLLADPAHHAAGAEDLREVVALPQLSLEALVLLHQPLAIRLEQPLDLHRLGDHRRDDAEELRGPLVIAVRLEPQLDAQRADGAAVHDQRDTDERPLVAVRAAFGQGRLAADTRHDDRPRALDDATHQRAAGHGAVRHAIAAAGDRRNDLQVRAVLARGNRDRAAHARRATSRGSRGRGAARP